MCQHLKRCRHLGRCRHVPTLADTFGTIHMDFVICKLGCAGMCQHLKRCRHLGRCRHVPTYLRADIPDTTFYFTGMITMVLYWIKLKICVAQNKFIEQCTSGNKPLSELILNQFYAVPTNGVKQSVLRHSALRLRQNGRHFWWWYYVQIDLLGRTLMNLISKFNKICCSTRRAPVNNITTLV